jgi:glucokinase
MNALGIDLGGTQIKAVLATDAGEVLRREVRPTKDGEPHGWLANLRALADELGKSARLGISAPGLVSRDGASIGAMPGRLKGLEGLNWTQWFARAEPVPVTNDAQAALIGEAWIGAAHDLRDVILLTLGTGVGGAIMIGGSVLRGHLGRAGHFGHTCLDPRGRPSIAGMPGALECFVGNYNIRERTDGRFETTHELIAAAVAGDPFAREHWADSVLALACAIASFINILDPEAVLLGGGIAQAGDALFTPLREELARVEWRPTGAGVPLIPAALGEWAGAIGAARVALLEVGK